MKFKAKIYYWYKRQVTEVLRALIFCLLIIFMIVGSMANLYPNFFITLFGLFLIFEIYFSQKISKLMPKSQVSQNSGDIFDSFSLEALSIFETHKNSINLIKDLINHAQIKFIIEKSNASSKDISLIEIDKSKLADHAFNLSKSLAGHYVTTMDLFVVYLLLSEEKTKFLFNKKIKAEDIENILLWANHVYPNEEISQKARVNFAGEGIAEDWVYGWTLETQKYMIDLTREFLKEINNPIGRVNEYAQMVEALNKGTSVILVGDAGSGKESAVKEFAIDSFMGRLGGNLYHQRVYQLMVDAFLSGAQSQGELEERFNLTMQEVSHSGNVVIYIPEFQNLLGNQAFHLDISGSIIPYLEKGNVSIIAAVTPEAYKKYLEPMHSLLDAFTQVNFSEPSYEEVLDILFAKTLEIESKNNVDLSYRAIIAGAEYAKNYAKEKVAPGNAVILLEDTANVVSLSGKKMVEEQDVQEQVKKKVHVEVGEPKAVEKKLLLNLEPELHKRIVGQDEAVFAVSEAIRRLRTGMSDPVKPISFLFLGPTGVGKTETAKALADLYFGNSERLIRLDMSEFNGSDGEKRLLGAPPGQGDEKGQLTEAIYDSPYSLVLLDEFEKADQNILNLFLQVFDDGRLTDNKGKTVSFVNSIIIATSNAASEFIREQIANGVAVDKKFQENLIEFLETKGIFKPELLNRFDDIVVFKPLAQDEIMQIVKLMLTQVSKNLSQKDITVSFEERIIEKIATDAFDNDFGARPIRRYIQNNIEDLIAQKMLKDEIKRGDKITISVDLTNNIAITK